MSNDIVTKIEQRDLPEEFLTYTGNPNWCFDIRENEWGIQSVAATDVVLYFKDGEWKEDHEDTESFHEKLYSGIRKYLLDHYYSKTIYTLMELLDDLSPVSEKYGSLIARIRHGLGRMLRIFKGLKYKDLFWDSMFTKIRNLQHSVEKRLNTENDGKDGHISEGMGIFDVVMLKELDAFLDALDSLLWLEAYPLNLELDHQSRCFHEVLVLLERFKKGKNLS